jgi:hypothetical protein
MNEELKYLIQATSAGELALRIHQECKDLPNSIQIFNIVEEQLSTLRQEWQKGIMR